jgi:hypothetical protein
VHVRVELVAGSSFDRLQAAPAEHVVQLLVDHLDPLGDLHLLVLLVGVECPLEVVQHRQQLADQALGGTRHVRLRVARHALAEVVEVGRDPAQGVQVLVSLGAGLGQLGLGLGSGGLSGLRRHLSLVAHARSPDSSSTTSASTISSSELSPAPLPEDPSAEPPALAWACW